MYPPVWGQSHRAKARVCRPCLTIPKREWFPSPCRFCAVPFDYCAPVFCRCILIGSVNLISHRVWRAHVYTYSTCAHRYTDTPNDAFKTSHERGMKGKWQCEEGGLKQIEGRLRETRRALEGGRGGSSQDGFIMLCVCRYITKPPIMCRKFLPHLVFTKETHLPVHEWINSSLCFVLLNHGRGSVFIFCTMWFLEVAYFLARMLESTAGKRTECRSFFFSVHLELARPVIGAEINTWATFPLGLQRLGHIFFLFWLSPSALKWIRVIGSIFLTRMIVFQNRTPNSLCLC